MQRKMQTSTSKIWNLLKNLNIELPFAPAITLLGLYPKEWDTDYSWGTCIPMFIVTLFTIAMLWKQPRCPHADEWIKKMWYLYTMEFMQPWRIMKSYHLQVNGWNWRTSSWVSLARPRRPKIICSPLYADFRSRGNTTRGLDFDHMIRCVHTREVGILTTVSFRYIPKSAITVSYDASTFRFFEEHPYSFP
jgi:hypothetical protein